ncbi:electron transport complex subunit RsxB [Kaarinaea lacus]
MLTAVIALAVLAVIFGLALGYAAIRFKVEGDPLVEKIDALLPQTQCGQCTYAGCRPYAEAIAKGDADINQCPPGGETTIIALADLLGRDPKPLNPEHGEEKGKRVAVIDEEVCIGCTLCIQACPVDAILGAPKQMHTVIEDECTGCDLCVPPCPVDCIDMVEVKSNLDSWTWNFPKQLPKNLASLANQRRDSDTNHTDDDQATIGKKTGTGS